jgi:hypothetical protein
LKKKGEQTQDKKGVERLDRLLEWHTQFTKEKLFHPFMSDLIGNTICADLLDYLPRDRCNLGMEFRFHSRLQRYLTIRPSNDQFRVSIMVTRPSHGGQRRDVATAVLDIMRERYEMAERVYYHHKKCAASAMLAKLAEISPNSKPSDDESIYPAPWTEGEEVQPRHMVHFVDSSFIEHVGTAPVDTEKKDLQQRLHKALRYRRIDIYKTLLVVDMDLVRHSTVTVADLAKEMRGTKEKPTNAGRIALERVLAQAADAKEGDVLVYCAPTDMQSKEVDARVEIKMGRVVPLRLQKEEFAYWDDIAVLQQYYEELWRAYIFVSPELFKDPSKCRRVVDEFCQHFGICGDDRAHAYLKVRTHKFGEEPEAMTARALQEVNRFVGGLYVKDTPATIVNRLLRVVSSDRDWLNAVRTNGDTGQRLAALFDLNILQDALENQEEGEKLTKKDQARMENYCLGLKSGTILGGAFVRTRAAGEKVTFAGYSAELLNHAKTIDKASNLEKPN